MASVLTRYAWAGTTSVTDPLTASIALASGTGRKLIVCSVIENASATVDGLTFDGATCTRFVNNDRVNGVAQSWFYYDIADGKGAANYDLVFDFSAGSIRHAWTGWVTQGDTAGEPQTSTANSVDGVDTVAASIPTLSGDVLVTVVDNADQSGDFTSAPSSSQVTFGNRTGTSLSGTRAVKSDAVGDATETVTATWTQNSTTSTKRMYLVNSTPLVVGPTIDTQPTAVTTVIAGPVSNNPATFSVSATTSGGSLTYDWELETSVGGGVYSNLADGNGATWTGQSASSCSATLTATTLSGRRVRCNVTDSNGTTTTDAVALTIKAGTTIAQPAATDGSGVATAVLTTDVVDSANGQLKLITFTKGTTVLRTTARKTS